MKSGRTFLKAGGIALIIVVAIVAWDFAKFSRRIPASVPASERATLIVVDKAARRMMLYKGNQPLKSYDVVLGSDPVGHKQREGDGRTPEGPYSIDFKNGRSRFHLALRVSYPDAKDRDSAKARGVPAGSDIMIHGLPNGLGFLGDLHLMADWTDGCVAVTNREIEEIWSLVDVGTTIQINP
jgi:murein L,D-transpeptidase YafK